MNPKCSIIIVNWNLRDLLDRCLASIQKYAPDLPYEIIVVDNASEDGSAEMVQRKYPKVILLAETENLGFGRGNNLGLRHASGEYIFYLNNDVELIEDATTPLVQYLESHPEVGIIGCKLLNTDRTHQNSIGRFLRLSSLVREYFLREKSHKTHVYHPDTPTAVESILGACLLVRGDVVGEVGGFDERYFMYQEETDMCLSFRKRGYQTVYYPLVSMIHHGSKSSNRSEESRQRTLFENRKSQYLFFQKQYSPLAALTAKLVIALAMLIRLPVLWALKTVRKDRNKQALKIKYYLATVRWLFRGINPD